MSLVKRNYETIYYVIEDSEKTGQWFNNLEDAIEEYNAIKQKLCDKWECWHDEMLYLYEVVATRTSYGIDDDEIDFDWRDGERLDVDLGLVGEMYGT